MPNHTVSSCRKKKAVKTLKLIILLLKYCGIIGSKWKSRILIKNRFWKNLVFTKWLMIRTSLWGCLNWIFGWEFSNWMKSIKKLLELKNKISIYLNHRLTFPVSNHYKLKFNLRIWKMKINSKKLIIKCTPIIYLKCKIKPYMKISNFK